MKSVLISIQPKWCELIASGKKTVEVRKTRPKFETPFKCYIYCTNGENLYLGDGHEIECEESATGKSCYHYLANGKVIGEFVCDRILEIDCDSVAPFDFGTKDYIDDEICFGRDELIKYAGFIRPFGWHISDLVIYDKPKELSEFWAYNEELHKRYDSERDFCCYDGSNENGEPLTDCGDAYNNIMNCYRCWEEWTGWCHHVTRPPQSWCYVEEVK